MNKIVFAVWLTIMLLLIGTGWGINWLYINHPTVLVWIVWSFIAGCAAAVITWAGYKGE